jgi:hypothetical protein
MASARIPNLSVFGVVAALLCAPSGAFAFKVAYTVGGDGSCDFPDIQAAVAAAVANPPHNIFVAANKTYTAEKITINNLDLAITGGFTSCADSLAPSGNSTISGAGNGGQDSVFFITGTSNVFLSNLSITGGNLPSNKTGGGISFVGNGSLTVSDSSVFNNAAGFGAGINVNGSGGAATLTIGENMFITGNTAQDSGGGIRVEGNTRLFILADGVFIAQNHATVGNGGGVQVVGPARADIGSPGAGNSGVISDNHAVNGGGVSVDAGQGGGLSAVLRLFSTDSTRLARISSNVASNVGGGVYLKPFTSLDDGDVYGILCAHDYRIDANAAMEGSAIYADTNSSLGAKAGGIVILATDAVERGTFDCDPEPTAALGAVACSLGASCNMIDGNQAIDINNNNQPTDGAAIFEQDGSELYVDQLMLRGNSGGYAVRETGDDAEADLHNCLFAENQLRHELIFGDSGAFLNIRSCTFANDTIGAADVIRNDFEVSLLNSIIDEAGTATLHYLGDAGNLRVSYVLSNDISTLPSDPSIIVGDPLFVDMAHGDYRLSATKVGSTILASPAIDFAPTAPDFDHDIAGNPRDQDVGAIADRFGVRDLGAYEMQPITDRIFADGFGDPISLVY